MRASHESVSASAAGAARVLVVGVNWLGDSIMTLPALEALRRRRPGVRLVLLVKPALAPLWGLYPGAEAVLPLAEGLGGTWRTARAVRAGRFPEALVLPHSFRSALIPFLAGVPIRRGLCGHGRDWMLTEALRPAPRPGRGHQMDEYLQLLAPEAGDELPAVPWLVVPEGPRRAAEARLAAPGPVVGFFPGAAYGPSKRWPAERFGAVGCRLAAERGCRVAIFGSPRDAAAAAQVAAQVGPAALNLAGRTTLTDLAALLTGCAVVLGNDSGGLHLAAALGVPVVGIFGITDPAKTGPLGGRQRVLMAPGWDRRRDVPRVSAAAAAALAAISADAAYAAVGDLLGPAPAKAQEVPHA